MNTTIIPGIRRSAAGITPGRDRQNHRRMNKPCLPAALLALLVLLAGCERFFEVNPDDLLLEKDYPGTLTELYSGYMGVAATVQQAADKASFLEALRGDFAEPTSNSTKDIVDLYQYNNLSNNALADPVDYYRVILNANDYIGHATAFFISNPATVDEATFRALVGGALRYKVWAYLMLSKIYGEAVWIDTPFSRYEEISSLPVTGAAELVDRCIALLETGITAGSMKIDGKGILRWSQVLFPGQSESASNLEWNRINPPPECLLAELYLFAGNYDKVVENVLALIRAGGEEASYQLNKSEWGGEWIKPLSSFFRKESIFMFTYDYNLKQTNRLIDYYSNLPPNRYLLRPSQAAMDRFYRQVRSDGNLGDNNRGENRTFKLSNGEWVISKFTQGHETADKVFRNDVLITLCKASDIHLWLAEALGQLGRFTEALAFLDGGIESYYNSSTGTFAEPFTGYPVSLYRTSSSSEGACQGVRGRVTLNKAGDRILKNPSADIEQDKFFLDSLIVEETCLESAGEARALYAMIRVAKRWNKPEIVADRVSAKYPEGTREAIRMKLMNPEAWYIKYPLK